MRSKIPMLCLSALLFTALGSEAFPPSENAVGSPVAIGSPVRVSIDPENRRYHFGMQACVDGPGKCDDGNIMASAACDNLHPIQWNFSKIVSLVAADNGPAKTSCSQYQIAASPKWISSAVWVDKKSEIMVIDPKQNEIFLYAVGSKAPEVLLPDRPKEQKVNGAAKSRVRYIIKAGTNALILNADLRVNQELDIRRDHLGHFNGLGSFYDWDTTPDQIFAIGMFNDSPMPDPRNFHLGFLKADLGKDAASVNNAKLLMPLEDSPYYVLGHNYVATNDFAAFVLKMKDDSDAELWEFDRNGGRKRRLLEKTFPAEFRHIPRIVSGTDGPGDSASLFKEIEGYHIPVGVYGFERMLYLLARSPSESGATTWWLYKIDPQKDKIVGKRLRLPTTSNHISIVPTSTSWFIFEKGPVQSKGSQKIETLITIPTSWIINPSSPLVEDSKGSTCVRTEKKTA
jgi:hypothetical protein